MSVIRSEFLSTVHGQHLAVLYHMLLRREARVHANSLHHDEGIICDFSTDSLTSESTLTTTSPQTHYARTPSCETGVVSPVM